MRASKAALALGEQIALARRRRGLTQAQLAARVGIDRSRQSQIELGRGVGVPADLWFALADALGIPFRMELGRDPAQELEDAGHLEMQELVLGLGRSAGLGRTFELATRPSNPAFSVDVGLRDDRRRLLVLVECWNTFANIGAAVRSTQRKVAQALALAVALGGERGPYSVAACWVVRDAPRNRAVLERYPEVFETTFTGLSSAWARALTQPGVDPPQAMGLVWCDPRRGLIRPWHGR